MGGYLITEATTGPHYSDLGWENPGKDNTIDIVSC